MTKKTYRCVCPVCRKQHDVEAEFLSSPRSFVVDGVSYPSYSCGAHTPAELRTAWNARREGALALEHEAEFNVNETFGWSKAQIARNNALINKSRALHDEADAIEAIAS
jgi:hypothetical protein